MEVVQRIGYDSYTPDNGVLIAKNKDRPSFTGGPNGPSVYSWTIDAHPEDINKLDFRRPNGEPVMRTIADYRQLNDALFHAGNFSGSRFEWVDAPNRLHFYVVDMKRDTRGILSYTMAVRSLDGRGAQPRGVEVQPIGSTLDGPRNVIRFTVKNAGIAAAIPTDAHPRRRDSAFGSDVYRLTATIEGAGWSADLVNPLSAVAFGGSAEAMVHARHTNTASASAKVTLRAVSESDPTKIATASYTISR